ncbi:hypothetical protein [Vampirovibrio sp.]|uniref:hypothetical protein n=1 Tax=Vampirovibrio sp. TaxID=2717857 RepID=UPI0035947A60
MVHAIAQPLQSSQTKPSQPAGKSRNLRPETQKAGLPNDRFQTNRPPLAKFGDKEEGGILNSLWNFTKKATAVTVGLLSTVGLTVGVPLGLMQMAVGLFFHPLLITGALTIGIPLAGAIGSVWLFKK